MKRIRLNLAFAVVTMVLALSVAPEAAAADREKLSGEDIRKLLAGNSLKGQTRDAYKVISFHGVDGSLHGAAGFPDYDEYDRGRWDIEGDQYCREYNRWRNGVRDCFDMYRRSDGRYEFERTGGYGNVRGTQKSVWEVVPGNPEDL